LGSGSGGGGGMKWLQEDTLIWNGLEKYLWLHLKLHLSLDFSLLQQFHIEYKEIQ
jgi:hypothetical protein